MIDRMEDTTTFPETFEDLWLMRETSNGWFDGSVKYENIRCDATPEVGMVDSKSWNVVPYSNCVYINLVTKTIDKVSKSGNSLSLSCKTESVAKYETMEKFRESEWWSLAMKKFVDGDTDASWLDSVSVDDKEFINDERSWIAYGPVTTISMEVGRYYTDWLNNRRQKNGHDTLSIEVDRMSGSMHISCGYYDVCGTVKEINQAVQLFNRLKELGVAVGDDHISIPIIRIRSIRE